jgi:hypothetical protein
MESKVCKTYDGVDVSVGDFVYKCWKTGKNRWYDQPSFIRSKRLKIYDFESDDALFFKHKKNATAYVKFMNDDSMPKPTTINSIEDIGKIYGTGHIIMPPTPTIPNPDIHSAQMFGTPPFSASAKALKEYDEWKKETNRLTLLSQFSHAYNIPINTVLEFIVNQKTTPQ